MLCYWGTINKSLLHEKGLFFYAFTFNKRVTKTVHLFIFLPEMNKVTTTAAQHNAVESNNVKIRDTLVNI